MTARLLAALAVVLLFASGCCRPARPTAPPARPALGTWRTLSAEHRVTIDYTAASGNRARSTLRGVIAVERPARFRLRALGPAGITLFDVLYVGGEVRVLAAVRDAGPETSLGRIVRAMASDLAAAFALDPPVAGRTTTVEPTEIAIRGPDVTVRLSRFVVVGDGVAPERMEIDNHRLAYHVTVEVVDQSLDPALDPALFTPR